ncbi:DUF4231 domain-containing protein [Pseudomaricurvus alkylphenolicus]|uniref:DUF4231 domain-containing protein n=1 Tax=Pseudomaricurvus alkylphenolicus TaxID=1306991 RepID=UPI00142258CB|nr:DUF4231 domain-containing protein [Pseudomaricurvus alkylphenolicus]NIB45211.1 DUF4231 domain-containing protein [Pseudomaricurvus alkylphenolicus]
MIDEAIKIIEGTIVEIDRDYSTYSSRAERLRKLNSFFNVSTIILGVSAPAFVTYQTQQEDASQLLVFVSIILVAVASATATLRGVLRWSERFGYTALTSLYLQELSSSVKLEKEDIIQTVKKELINEKLSELNRNAQKRRGEIIRGYLEKEVAAVEKAESSQKELMDKTNKTGGNSLTSQASGTP